ncbi:MAG: tetratricopeptide repeat protein, partial [Planctomycetota bacterium]
AGKLVRKMVRFEGKLYKAKTFSGETVIRKWPKPQTLVNPIWWCTWVFQFVWRWFQSRPYLPMLLAIPAVAILSVFWGLVSAGSRMSRGSTSISLKRLVKASMQEKDYNAAAFGADALIKLYPDSKEHRFNRAKIHAAADESEQAIAMMSALATNDKHTESALWLANRYGGIENYFDLTSEEQLDYLRWLSQAIENDPSLVRPRVYKATILESKRDFQGAYTTLLAIASESIEIQYRVAFLERELGLTKKARDRAASLIRLLRTSVDKAPQETKPRLQLASMLIFTDQEGRAIELLTAGLRLAAPEDHSKIRNALVEALVIDSGKTIAKDRSPRGLMRGLDKLKQAMAIDATNPALLEAVARACVAASESTNNEMIVLREALVQGVNSDTAHFILGTIALNEGDVASATSHLDIAAHNNPNLPGLLNNLAFAILQEEEPDLARALRLSDAALRSLPEHPYLRETRGQIYLRLEKYAEAIADLEKALVAKELRSSIRPSLAIAYDAIGQPKIAERQRDLLGKGK